MKKFAIILSVTLLLLPVFALAQTNACDTAASSDPSNIGKCINQVYIWSLGAGALLALVMIVFGGYITLTAAGNAERASRGKNFIFSSVVGLILLFGAYLLLNTINPDLVNFKINLPNSNNSPTSTQLHQ